MLKCAEYNVLRLCLLPNSILALLNNIAALLTHVPFMDP